MIFLQPSAVLAGTASAQLTVRAFVLPKCLEWSSEAPRFQVNSRSSCLASKVEVRQKDESLEIRCAPAGCPRVLYRETAEGGHQFVEVMF